MEGVGARLGRSSTRYGPATVFTGPVRKWKKKWVHVPPSNTAATSSNNNHHHHHANISSNGNSSSNGSSNDNASHLMLYKWTPIGQNQSAADDNDDVKDEGTATEEEDEPPRRKIKYIPIAFLEEQKKESAEDEESVERDQDSYVDGKPDINDVPMEENEVSEATNAGREDLNESKLDLNARDGDGNGDGDGDGTEEQAQAR